MYLSVLDLLKDAANERLPERARVFGELWASPTGLTLRHLPACERSPDTPLVVLRGSPSKLEQARNPLGIWVEGRVRKGDSFARLYLDVSAAGAVPTPWAFDRLIQPLPLIRQHALLESLDPHQALEEALLQETDGAYGRLKTELAGLEANGQDDGWVRCQLEWLERQRLRWFSMNPSAFFDWARRQDLARHGVSVDHEQPGWNLVTDPMGWRLEWRDDGRTPVLRGVYYSLDMARSVLMGTLLLPVLGTDLSRVRWPGDSDPSDPAAYYERGMAAFAKAEGDPVAREYILSQMLNQLMGPQTPVVQLTVMLSRLGQVLTETGRHADGARMLGRAAAWYGSMPGLAASHAATAHGQWAQALARAGQWPRAALEALRTLRMARNCGSDKARVTNLANEVLREVEACIARDRGLLPVDGGEAHPPQREDALAALYHFHTDAGNAGEALRHAVRLVWFIRHTPWPRGPEEAQARYLLARHEAETGQRDTLAWARTQGALRAARMADDLDLQLRCLELQVRILLRRHQPLQAMDRAREHLELSEAGLPRGDAAIGSSHAQTAGLLIPLHRWDDAERHLLRALRYPPPAGTGLSDHEAQLHAQLGQVRAAQQRHESALASLQLARLHWLGGAPDTEPTAQIARVERQMAHCLIGLGRPQEAESAIKSALARLQRLHGRRSVLQAPGYWDYAQVADAMAQPDLADRLLATVLRLVVAEQDRRPLERAQDLIRHALVQRERADSDGARETLLLAVAELPARNRQALDDLVTLFTTRAERGDSMPAQELGWMEAALKALHDANGEAHALGLIQSLAQRLHDAGEHSVARILMSRLADSSALSPREQAQAQRCALDAALALGDLSRAHGYQSACERRYAKLDKAGSPVLSELMLARGTWSLLAGEHAQAAERAEQVLAVENRFRRGQQTRQKAQALLMRAEASLQLDPPTIALAALEEAYAVAQQVWGPGAAELARPLRMMAVALFRRGDAAQAISLQRRAAVLHSTAPGAIDPSLALNWRELGEQCLSAGDAAEAEQIARRLIRLMAIHNARWTRAQVLAQRGLLARAVYANGRPREARNLLRLALRELEAAPAPLECARVLMDHAALLALRKRLSVAIRLAEAAVRALESAFGADQSKLVEPLGLVLSLRRQRNWPEDEDPIQLLEEHLLQLRQLAVASAAHNPATPPSAAGRSRPAPAAAALPMATDLVLISSSGGVAGLNADDLGDGDGEAKPPARRTPPPPTRYEAAPAHWSGDDGDWAMPFFGDDQPLSPFVDSSLDEPGKLSADPDTFTGSAQDLASQPFGYPDSPDSQEPEEPGQEPHQEPDTEDDESTLAIDNLASGMMPFFDEPPEEPAPAPPAPIRLSMPAAKPAAIPAAVAVPVVAPVAASVAAPVAAPMATPVAEPPAPAKTAAPIALVAPQATARPTIAPPPAAPSPIAASPAAASAHKALIRAIVKEVLPDCPASWREMVVSWRGNAEPGRFVNGCRLGNGQEAPLPAPPTLHQRLVDLRAAMASKGEAPFCSLRLWVNRAGKVEIRYSQVPVDLNQPAPALFREGAG